MSTGRTMLDYALAYARRNMRVFPLHAVHERICSCGQEDCSSAGKHPRTKNGVKDATSDLVQIEQWWQRWPDANIGIATGSGLYVIDVDCAKGGTLESLKEMGVQGLMWTLTACTGSGGYHLYLHCDEALPNSANRLARFVDTRCEGGYVVAPPSCNKHGKYLWYNSLDMQPMPAELLSRIKAPAIPLISYRAQPLVKQSEQEKLHYARTKQKDTPASYTASAQAQHTSASSTSAAPASVASEARNDYLIRRAGALRGDGFTAEEICGILQALNNTRYGAGRHPQGPLSLEELENTIFKSVVRWEEQSGLIVPEEPVVQRMCDLLDMDLPPVPWIVPDLISEGLTLLAGKPKVGKSWLILGLAIACALGSNAAGRNVLGRYPVEPMGVFYLSLEDHASRVRTRTSKMLNGRHMPENFGLALRWKPLKAGGFEDLETYLLTAPDTRLVIIDTLARVRQAGEGTNNSYQEDSELMGRLQQLATAHHLGVVVVHHLRKMSSEDVFDEVSGTLGLTGSADTCIILKRERYQNDGTLHITGRDVEEQELAATFTRATGYWSVTGSAEERRLNDTRRDILALLNKRGAMRPVEIAQELKKTQGTIRTALSRMAQEGLVAKESDRRYKFIDVAERRGECSIISQGEADAEWDDLDAEWLELEEEDD